MTWFTLLPAVLTVALGVLVGRVAVPLHPLWCARVLGTVAAATTLATVGTLVFVSVNYWAGLQPATANRLPEWVLFGDDHPVPSWLGLPAVVLAFGALGVLVRLALHWRRQVREAQEAADGVVETDQALAVAVPGRRGGVLVSRGLLTALTGAELQVVFEHEEAHLRHRHHRYLAAGAAAAAVLPFLRGLNERLRFCVERWADEEAAEAVGDRAFVAETIAKVALLRGPAAPGALPAFTGSGVVRRVRALLAEPPGRNPVGGPVALGTTGTITGTLVLIALHLDHAFQLTFL